MSDSASRLRLLQTVKEGLTIIVGCQSTSGRVCTSGRSKVRPGDLPVSESGCVSPPAAGSDKSKHWF